MGSGKAGRFLGTWSDNKKKNGEEDSIVGVEFGARRTFHKRVPCAEVLMQEEAELPREQAAQRAYSNHDDHAVSVRHR